MYPIVSKAVQRSEENSQRLANESRGLSKEKFAEALNENAVKIVEGWKALYGQLLVKHNSGAGVQYAHCPIPDTPVEY